MTPEPLQSESPPTLRQRLAIVLLTVLGIAILLSLAWGFSMLSGRPFGIDLIVTPLVAFLLIGGYGIFATEAVRIESVPEPLASRILEVLEADDLRGVRLHYGPRGNAARFPRPEESPEARTQDGG